MWILVTGCRGFIGKYTGLHWRAAEAECTARRPMYWTRSARSCGR